MARKTISQRIALEGGDAIKKQLAQLGDSGEQAFTDIQKAATKLKGPGAEFARSLDAAIKKARELGEGLQRVWEGMRKIGAGMSVGVTAPIVAIGTKAVAAWRGQEETVKRVEAALRSTGNTVGFTSEELQKMASELQKITTFGDEAILGMQSILLSFTEIKGDQFRGATDAVLDLAAFLGTDLQSAALQVGKALQDPVAGINALKRSGVSLSPVQREMIKGLVATGKTAEAQGVILDGIAGQIGTFAEDMAKTDFGPLDQALNDLGDSWEELGKAMAPVLVKVAEGIQALSGLMNTAVTAFTELPERTQNVVLILGGLAAAFGPVLFTLGMITTGLGSLVTGLATLGGFLAPIVMAFTGLGTAAGGLVGALTGLGPIIAGIAAALLSWPVLIAGLVTGFAALAVAIYQNWDRIEARISGALARIGEMFAGIGPAIQNGLAGLGEAISNTFAALDGMASGFVEKLREAIQTGLASFVESITEMFSGIPALAAAAWEALPDGLQEAGNAIRGMFSGVFDFIKGKFDQLDAWADGIVKSIRDKVQSVLKAIGLANDATSGSSSGGGDSILRGFASGGHVPVSGPAPAAMRRARPADGPIRGPGTGTSDSIVSKVRTGSYIIQAKAVRYYGKRLLEQLNRLRQPVGSGVSRARSMASSGGAILARLSNGEFAVRPEAVQHYGADLFDLLNRLRLLKDGMPAFAAGGPVSLARDNSAQLIAALRRLKLSGSVNLSGLISGGSAQGSGGATPGFASGGLVSLAPAAQGTVRILDQLRTLHLPERVALPTFAGGDSVLDRSVQNISHALANYRSQVSHVINRTSGMFPAFASGGHVTNSAVRNFGDSVRACGARLSQTFNSVRAMPAFASGGMVAMMGAPMMLMPSLATGGLVSTTPKFEQSANAINGQQYDQFSLTIGNERFDGMMSPREVTGRLRQQALSEDVKSAGRRPNWFGGI